MRRRWLYSLALLAVSVLLPAGNCRDDGVGNNNDAFAWLQLGKDVEDVELGDATERVNLRYQEDAGYFGYARTCYVSGTFAFDAAAFELVDCRNTTNPGFEPNVDFDCVVLSPGLVRIDVWKTDGGHFASDDHELMKTEFAILTETPGDYPAPGVEIDGLSNGTKSGACAIQQAGNYMRQSTSIWRAQ
jgi:hypothetical protein